MDLLLHPPGFAISHQSQVDRTHHAPSIGSSTARKDKAPDVHPGLRRSTTIHVPYFPPAARAPATPRSNIVNNPGRARPIARAQFTSAAIVAVSPGVPPGMLN